ncbi:ER membrane protein complex subunit 4, putative [Hepatocystis sp. ex Piliocolobus tephrosceles]|nr:ER membrane protein complex subunit 4, putative [Hepatocystis sp. ex Piliocolobus tephrosceles]
MSRWSFNLKNYNDNGTNLSEPFGYNFEKELRGSYMNGDSYIKTEKNIHTLRKMYKNDKNKTETCSFNEQLLEKKAWNVCMNTFKGLIMNVFVMFMSGGASGIFGIIFVMYSIYNIIKSLLNINDAFKDVESDSNQKFLVQKIAFALLNLAVLIYIMNICSNSGLIPINSSDYFYFIPHQKIKQKGMFNVFQ